MAVQGLIVITVSSFLCIYLILTISKLLYKLWWRPIRIQKLLASQGIKGPSYNFMYGTTKESLKMKTEAMSKPMSLSHDILSTVQPDVYLWRKQYGRNYLTWYGPRAVLVVSEPELIKEILTNKDAFPRGEIPESHKKLLGNAVSTCDGEPWIKKRKLANYAFSSENLKGMIPAMIAATEMMLERWKHQEGREIEVHHEFRLFSSEVISRTLFGSSYMEGKDIFEMLMKVAFILQRSIFKLRFPLISKIWRTKDEIESDILLKGICHSVMEIIKKREEKVKDGEEESFGEDFLGVLLNAYNDSDDNRRMSLQDLIDECKNYYMAGQATTTSLLTWAVLLLAMNTEWQERARDEVIKIFGQATPNPDGIAKLKIMNMIINETLRLYPPAVANGRSVESEVRLGELILPAEVGLYISTLSVHHDTHIWGQDAHLFKPERFAEGIAKATNNNLAAFIPFGLGPRTCVGYNYALLKAKIALSMILQRYSFTLSPTYVHLPTNEFTLHPGHGVQVILHRLS